MLFRKQYNIELFELESFRTLYKNRVEKIIETNPLTDTEDVAVAGEKLKDNILRAANEALGKRKINTGNLQNFRTRKMGGLLKISKH